MIQLIEKYAVSDHLSIVSRPKGGELLKESILEYKESGIGVLVSLLAQDEKEELELSKEGSVCQEMGIQFISFPIPDRQIPESISSFLLLCEKLNQLIIKNHIGIHCRAGIGRSGLLACCLLLHQNFSPEEAIAKVSNARGVQIPDTEEQKEWIALYGGYVREK